MSLILPDDDPEGPKYVDDDDDDICQLSARAFSWTHIMKNTGNIKKLKDKTKTKKQNCKQ